MPLSQPFPAATTQISLPVTNSEKRLIETASARVLGTAASTEDKAEGGIEKQKTGCIRSNQRG